MKWLKRFLLAAALAAVASGASAYNWYAPNSFDTVKTDSWAYQTVYTLTEKGRAPGYTTDFFKGKDLTRYELASVIKTLLENHKQGDGDEEALARLKKDYARELEAQGYKEPGREPSKVKPIFEFHGDTRVRARDGGDSDARARVTTKWHIGDQTTVVAGGEAETKK